MSKKESENLSARERADLAAQVKSVRVKLGFTQQELADAAGVTRQSIGTIESGERIPQTKTLVSVLETLGIAPRAAAFSAQTSRWLAIVGGIMDSIPSARRDLAGQAAVEVVTNELVKAGNVGSYDDNDIPHIGSVDVDALRQGGHALAADERDGVQDEQEQSQETP